jgi:hypothetical protein
MSELVGFATWYELRCPTDAGTVVWNGKVLDVRQLHIDADRYQRATYFLSRRSELTCRGLSIPADVPGPSLSGGRSEIS